MNAGGAVRAALPSRRAGMLAALAAAATFGGVMPFTRLAAQAGVSGADLGFYRVSLLVLVGGLWLAARPVERAVAKPLRLPLVGFGLGVGLVGVAYLSSVAYIPVGLAAILFFTFPLIVTLTGPLLENARLSLYALGLVVLALVGLAAAVGPDIGQLDRRGVMLALLAALLAAMLFHCAARVAPHLPRPAAVFWVHAIAWPAVAAAAWASGGPSGAALTLAAWPALVVVLAYLVGFFLQLAASSAAPAALVTQLFFLEPVAAIASASLLLGERLSPIQYAGAALVLVALILIARDQEAAPELARPPLSTTKT